MNKAYENPSMGKNAYEGWEYILKKSMGPVYDSWEKLLKGSMGEGAGEHIPRGAESLYNTFQMYQKCMGGLGAGTDFDSFKEFFDISPDIALGFTNTCLQGFIQAMEHAGEWIEKRGKTLSAGDIQELDRDLLGKLSDIYEAEFKKYLKLPQLGMGRIYQERALEALDKLNTLQLTLSEFLHYLYLPIERSLTSLQKEIIRLAESEGMDDKATTYYKLWISYLEGHYMEIFKQPEYSEAMGKTIWALSDFVQARQVLLNDALKQVNIPTNTDFDELSKEIYLLKKRVRLLEKGA